MYKKYFSVPLTTTTLRPIQPKVVYNGRIHQHVPVLTPFQPVPASVPFVLQVILPILIIKYILLKLVHFSYMKLQIINDF